MGPVTALAGVCLQDVERGAHEGGKRPLASRLRPVSSKATHTPTYLPLHKDIKLVMSDVTAKLLQVAQRNISGGSSKPAGGVKSQAFTVAAPKKPFDKKSVVCYYCDKKGHMKGDFYKRKADEAKG